MTKSDVLTLRINPQLKVEGNTVLSQLGLTPSSFVSMAYSQLVRRQGVPFAVTLTNQPDLGMNKAEFDEMVKEGRRQIAAKEYRPVDEVFAEMDKKYGL